MEDTGSTSIAIIVRRGALRRFDALKRKSADLPVSVLWDRRTGEPRSGSAEGRLNRRTGDRRQKPPFTWDVADFVVLETAPPTEAPRATAPPQAVEPKRAISRTRKAASRLPATKKTRRR